MDKFTKFKEKSNKISIVLQISLMISVLPLSVSGANSSIITPNNVSLEVYMTQKKVTLKHKDKPIRLILEDLQKQTGINFAINATSEAELKSLTINVSNVSVEDALTTLLANKSYTFTIENNIVTIEKFADYQRKASAQPRVQFKGKLIDDKKQPIIGATLSVIGTTMGGHSDEKGSFSISVPKNSRVEISCLGFNPVVKIIKDTEANAVIILETDELVLDDVIVTGIFERKSESFTGSAATYSIKDLKQIGGSNILQSLKTLDPAFIMLDSKKYGSDPNRMPEIQLRGVTTAKALQSEYENDPNCPLFVLDGVECTLEDIVRLNMDRIESITILKDAASTAIYGSKAANGVIVVETVKPKPGALRLSYSANFAVQMPDLSDYKLMNAAEKLEFERLAGRYDPEENTVIGELYAKKRYNEVYKEILRGVDTYWMSYPIRTALNHSHNIYVDGGDNAMRYGIGLSYNNNNGVMKGSNNSTVGANIDLSYRTKKLIFSNKFSTSINMSKKEPVSFDQFSKQNPYYRPYNEDGSIKKYVYEGDGTTASIMNPLYLMSFANTDENKSNTFRNAFSIDWMISTSLRINARFNVSQNSSVNSSFKSPHHPDYDKISEDNKRGQYTFNNKQSFSYDGRATITYGKLINDAHQINAVGGWDFRENINKGDGYIITGFASDEHKNPQFSSGFQEGQRPSYSKSVSRSTSFFANANYSYKNKYLLDANYRADGTSRFGSNNVFNNTWAFGLGWNIHNEAFLKNISWFNFFKIRGSIGNPGNQNFDPYIANRTYVYNVNYQNVFGPSAITNTFGNPDLKWQKTMDRNIGLDISFLNNKFRVTLDYYNKKTEPQVINITIPISTGTNSIKANYGGLKADGINGTLNATVFSNRNITWNVNYNFRTSRNKYYGMGNNLSKLNSDMLNKLYNNGNKSDYETNELLGAISDTDSFKRFYDGSDIDDLYTVISAGIDPATGHELFYSKDGHLIFKYRSRDEVKVGNSRPELEGVIGTNVRYKNFNFSVNFRYSFGAESMASAMYQKVENITRADVNYNVDKRALYDRWKNPGDIAKFKTLRNFGSWTSTPISSRFLVTENTLSLESLSVSYEIREDKLKKLGLSGISISGYMNNIFKISTLKEERGLEYPFSRSFSISLGIRF